MQTPPSPMRLRRWLLRLSLWDVAMGTKIPEARLSKLERGRRPARPDETEAIEWFFATVAATDGAVTDGRNTAA